MLATFGSLVLSKTEKENPKLKKFGAGAVVGILLFLPVQSDISLDAQDTYAGVENKYQEFERNGYKLFSGWADDIAIAITDTEMESIIAKSGIGTKETIINTYAAKVQYQKMRDTANSLYSVCQNHFNADSMKMPQNSSKFLFSDNSSTVFPQTENWAYAMALYNNVELYPRITNQAGFTEVVKQRFEDLKNDETTGTIKDYFYPEMSVSVCGKLYFQYDNFKQKYDVYDQAYHEAISTQFNEDSKLKSIKE